MHVPSFGSHDKKLGVVLSLKGQLVVAQTTRRPEEASKHSHHKSHVDAELSTHCLARHTLIHSVCLSVPVLVRAQPDLRSKRPMVHILHDDGGLPHVCAQ